MLESQLNETRTRKQLEISQIDGELKNQYEAKLQNNLDVSIMDLIIFLNFETSILILGASRQLPKRIGGKP